MAGHVSSFALLVCRLGVWKLCTHVWRGFQSYFRQSFGRHWKRFSHFIAPPNPILTQDCRWNNQVLNLFKLSAPSSETRLLDFELAFAFGLPCIKSRETYSINNNDVASAASCLPRVGARLASCYEIDGLLCASNFVGSQLACGTRGLFFCLFFLRSARGKRAQITRRSCRHHNICKSWWSCLSSTPLIVTHEVCCFNFVCLFHSSQIVTFGFPVCSLLRVIIGVLWKD